MRIFLYIFFSLYKIIFLLSSLFFFIFLLFFPLFLSFFFSLIFSSLLSSFFSLISIHFSSLSSSLFFYLLFSSLLFSLFSFLLCLLSYSLLFYFILFPNFVGSSRRNSRTVAKTRVRAMQSGLYLHDDT